MGLTIPASARPVAVRKIRRLRRSEAFSRRATHPLRTRLLIRLVSEALSFEVSCASCCWLMPCCSQRRYMTWSISKVISTLCDRSIRCTVCRNARRVRIICSISSCACSLFVMTGGFFGHKDNILSGK